MIEKKNRVGVVALLQSLLKINGIINVFPELMRCILYEVVV